MNSRGRKLGYPYLAGDHAYPRPFDALDEGRQGHRVEQRTQRAQQIFPLAGACRSLGRNQVGKKAVREGALTWFSWPLGAT